MRNPMITAALAALLGAAAMPLACAQPAEHQHEASAATAAPAPGQRFATDAPLRAGMQGIRSDVADLAHYEMGHMSPEQAAQTAGSIEGHVRDIIANCKLPPDADAALHTIIMPLLQNATALKADPHKLDAIPPMRQSLAEYARQFDDPGVAAKH